MELALSATEMQRQPFCVRLTGIKFPGTSKTSSRDVWSLRQNREVYSYHLLLNHVQFTLIHGPNIPDSYAILFFVASDFTFISRHIHSWELFLLWPSRFILSGAICSSLLLFSSSILDTLRPGALIFWYHILATVRTPV